MYTQKPFLAVSVIFYTFGIVTCQATSPPLRPQQAAHCEGNAESRRETAHADEARDLVGRADGLSPELASCCTSRTWDTPETNGGAAPILTWLCITAAHENL